MEYFILPSLESVLLHNLHHFPRQYIAIIKFNNPNKKGFKKGKLWYDYRGKLEKFQQ